MTGVDDGPVSSRDNVCSSTQDWNGLVGGIGSQHVQCQPIHSINGVACCGVLVVCSLGVPAKRLPRTRPKRIQMAVLGSRYLVHEGVPLWIQEASTQSSHGQWNGGKNPGDVLAPSGRQSVYRSPAPAHELRNMCVSSSQALSRALSLTSKEEWFSHSISLKTPIHSLLLHLLHNISAQQSLPCIRKQSLLSS